MARSARTKIAFSVRRNFEPERHSAQVRNFTKKLHRGFGIAILQFAVCRTHAAHCVETALHTLGNSLPLFGAHFGGPNGMSMALANLYSELNRQAQMQGYQDVYMELSWMSMGLVVLAFLLSKNRPGAGPGSSAIH